MNVVFEFLQRRYLLKPVLVSNPPSKKNNKKNKELMKNLKFFKIQKCEDIILQISGENLFQEFIIISNIFTKSLIGF